MNPLLQKTAELSLVRALPDMLVKMCKPGRLNNLYRKLQREVNRELPAVKYTRAELSVLNDTIERFADATGWNGKERHALTYVSFLLALFDGQYPQIVAILNDIVDYFERGGNLLPANCWAGARAQEKWTEIVNQ